MLSSHWDEIKIVVGVFVAFSLIVFRWWLTEHPADEHLSSFVQHFSNISLLSTKPTRHPTGEQSDTSKDNKCLNCLLSKLTINIRLIKQALMTTA
jgi:hypothetical protein